MVFILLFNAIKYTSNGFIRVVVKHRKIDEQRELQLRISDSGCGIEHPAIENIFSLFNNIKLKNNVNSHGIGLGLTIVQKIVKALKGTIRV